MGTNTNCCGSPSAPDPADLLPISTDRRSFIKGVGALTGTAALSERTRAKGEDGSTGERDPSNAVMFIFDGMGPTQVTGSRYLKAYRDDPDQFPLNADPAEAGLNLDRHSSHGTMTTFPADPNEVVVDSAAGATSPGAIDCAAGATGIGAGVKTYNGAIGGIREDDEFVPVETILEAARDAGLATGLVTTTRITHATPAAFAAHVPHRSMEDEIARQYIEETEVDVLLGGGKDYFDPDERDDGADLLGAAEERGYEIVETAGDLSGVEAAPVLGLFTDDSHLDYHIDRQRVGGTQPGLVEMTEKALELLSECEAGFFLMVEAGRVDHCGHKNEPAILDEQLEGDEAVGSVLDFARDDSTLPTTVVTTADHECGGLSLARDGIYNVDYEMVDRLTASVTEGINPAIEEEVEDVEDLDRVMREVGGFELAELDRNHPEGDLYRSIDLGPFYSGMPVIRDLLNRKVLLGFTSHGHTGVDVPLYADGPNAEFFNTARDNTDIADVVADALGLV
ncbi:alkaline phosphatase [Natronococcus jeotgali]|uniref:alkaline phosphatase n=1 Tax=Natronococcus jeotgali TaxID=413812 RepID=UPI000677BD1D|nr:alkaline phosphatase [Natronococcus jeotgali]